jgi:DNA-binding response OmpR family regulator
MPRSVLLVGSDLEQSQLVSTLLHSDGFDVRVACTGSDAVALMGKRLSRFVLIDEDPPDISASNLAVHLKALAETVMPTLCCTTIALRGDILRGESIDGFDYALTKPVQIEVLSQLLAIQPQVI